MSAEFATDGVNFDSWDLRSFCELVRLGRPVPFYDTVQLLAEGLRAVDVSSTLKIKLIDLGCYLSSRCPI